MRLSTSEDRAVVSGERWSPDRGPRLVSGFLTFFRIALRVILGYFWFF
jgi:hypothetical protein